MGQVEEGCTRGPDDPQLLHTRARGAQEQQELCQEHPGPAPERGEGHYNRLYSSDGKLCSKVMCGVYRSGGSGYGGPASDEKFFDPEKVYTIHTYSRFYLELRDFTHFESWRYFNNFEEKKMNSQDHGLLINQSLSNMGLRDASASKNCTFGEQRLPL